MKVRFTLHDWLWLVVVLALAIGWATEHWRCSQKTARQTARQQQQIKSLQGSVQVLGDDLRSMRTALRRAVEELGHMPRMNGQ